MSTIYDWSLRASENTHADDLVDWSEGQLPSTVNNSARGMMQRVREYLADTGGAIESTFTVDDVQQRTEIRLQTKSAFREYKKDIVLRFKAKGRNIGITTVAVNNLQGKQVYKVTEFGIALLSGNEMQQGCIYTLVYDEAIDGWQLLNPTPTQSQRDLASNLYPSGFIGTFAMQALPSGWLLCDGSAYSRSTYSDLFAAIGTMWGMAMVRRRLIYQIYAECFYGGLMEDAMLMLGAILRVCNRIHSNLIDMGVMRFFQSIFVKQEWTIGMVM
ncbi:Phage Tail Collar Domain [Candidatus Bartonella washoeensis]|nr:Phage Tail Collar Domain [Bartonella washoeensis]